MTVSAAGFFLCLIAVVALAQLILPKVNYGALFVVAVELSSSGAVRRVLRKDGVCAVRI